MAPFLICLQSFEEEDDSFHQLETVEHLTSTWGFI